MRRITAVLALVAAVGCSGPDPTLAVAIAGTTPDPAVARDAFVASVYEAAKRRDAATLAALQADPRAERPRDPALALAAASLDPHAGLFDLIAAYPHDPAGVRGDFRSRLDGAHLVRGGATYPVRLLSDAAATGDLAALVQLLRAYPAALGDDGLAAAYARGIDDAAHASPAKMLTALAAVDPATRLDVLGTVPLCLAHEKTLALLTPNTDAERATQKLLAETPTAPCVVVGNARGRRRSPHTRAPRTRAPQA